MNGLSKLLLLVAFAFAPLAARAADVRAFDVMGFRLGMTAEDVSSAAAAQGLRKVRQMPGPSFAQAVSIERGERIPVPQYEGVRRLEFEGERESVSLLFAPTPEGSRVVRIHYGFFGPGVTTERMTAQVLAKYGESDRLSLGRRVWGDTAPPLGRTGPSLEYDENPPPSLVGRRYVGTLILSDPTLERCAEENISAASAAAATGGNPRF